ncbi:competence protein CoiA family protein [Pseudomonas sp. LFM046]|uniref:competence protein CoiA family protein n=1 Tax=Pseudomonas sp. LFM046 TaxID=1608357 RepID=UPI000698E7D3|nr:competence protein CoiA family protein [Pseudomonas sp. LFM046]
MPVRCLNQDGQSIHAFGLDAAQREELRAENTRDHQLRTPCCGNGAVLKTSKLGTLFFAHQRRGPCMTKPESEEHITIKSLVRMALSRAGWGVATKVRGQTPDGQEWIADVMATCATSRFVAEVQWSTQTDVERHARQKRYRASGIKALWLFSQEHFPNSASVPGVRVGRTEDGKFVAYIRHYELHHYEEVHFEVRSNPVSNRVSVSC